MRDRSAFVFLFIILIVTIAFFAVARDDAQLTEAVVQESGNPTVRINGRPFQPVFEKDESGRMVIVVDHDDLFNGENTVEIQLGDKWSQIMTAKIPLKTQNH